MKITLAIVFLLYLIICLALFFLQEQFIFHPEKLPKNFHFPHFENVEEKFFPIPEGQLHALHFRTIAPKGIVLYFHGNKGALDGWGYAAEDFTKLGYEVLMPDYRSYGKSDGSLSEANINKDAILLYEDLKKNWPSSKIVIYGRSLGTGVATELATKVDAKLLILETPYTSMTAMAGKMIPIVPTKWLLKYKFDNLSKMKSIRCPIHIFAATKDHLTPHKHAVKLAQTFENSGEILTSIHGAGHGNIGTFPIFHDKLSKLLKE